LLRQLAGSAASIGQEYFLLDAGWYTGIDASGDFGTGVGNWEEIDRVKFPNGLGAFADYVRSKGLKFGLWFEPERVAKGSLLARQHPDWVLWLPNQNYGVLDYGRSEVQRWVCALFDRYIREFGIRYIRHDSNIGPLAYWDAADQPDRRGMHQIRHMEGLYRVLDWIRERHPETVLEGCASGGRRIDLESARRFHTFWISDHTADPHNVRFHLAGLNHFLPGSYQYVCYTLPLPSQKDFQPLPVGFQSMSEALSAPAGRIDLWPQAMKAQAKKHVEVHKEAAPLPHGRLLPVGGTVARPGRLGSMAVSRSVDRRRLCAGVPSGAGRGVARLLPESSGPAEEIPSHRSLYRAHHDRLGQETDERRAPLPTWKTRIPAMVVFDVDRTNREPLRLIHTSLRYPAISVSLRGRTHEP
jgi:hypothetical protein